MSPDEMLLAVQSAISVRNAISGFFSHRETKADGVSSVAKKALGQMLPKKTFEDMDIPLRIVATNFHT